MKKTIIALVALSGLAMAETVTLTDMFYSNPASWVYVYNQTDNNWQVSKNTTYTALEAYEGSPAANDPAFYGYTFSSTDGVQTMTTTGTAMTIAAPMWWWSSTKGVYVGENITFTGNDNGLRADTRFHFADITTTLFNYTDRVWKQGDMHATGSLTLSEENYEHTFFSVTRMQQANGGWDFSGFNVTDANGNALVYTTDVANYGKAGYFWIETTDFTSNGAYTAKLVAKALPEPATATLSLLALAGLASRRRRH